MTSVALLASIYVVVLAITAAALVRGARRKPAGSWPRDDVSNLYAVLAYTLLVLASVILVVVTVRYGGDRHAFAYLASAAVVLAVVIVAARRRATARRSR